MPWRRPLLHGVPWVGSPASLLVWQRSDFSPSRRGSLLASPHRSCVSQETARSPEFPGDPCSCAMALDPGRARRPRPRARCLAGRADVVVASENDADLDNGQSFRGSIPWPANPLSTLRDHGRPCTSSRSRKTRSRWPALALPVRTPTGGSLRKVSSATPLLLPRALLGALSAPCYCVAARLAVEIDGASHAGRERRDRLRDTFFRKRGIRVLRVTNEDALLRPASVLQQIRALLQGNSPLANRVYGVQLAGRSTGKVRRSEAQSKRGGLGG